MRIDFHTHLTPMEAGGDVAGILVQMAKHSIDRAVVVPSVWDMAGTPERIAVVNDFMAEQVKPHSEKLTAFGTVNPRHGEAAAAEIVRLAGLGMRGIKLFAAIQGFAMEDRGLLAPICAAAAEHHMAIAVYAGLQIEGFPYVMMSLHEFGKLAADHPETTFILCHMAFGSRDFLGIDRLASDSPNVYFETSGVWSPKGIGSVAGDGGLDRICYGSGYPYLEPEVEMLKVDLSGLTEAQQNQIMGGNGEKLLARLDGEGS